MENTRKYYPYGCTFLHETINWVYHAGAFDFKCNWRSNRSGFVHEWELYFKNHYVWEDKIQYYNRTWERFSYESLMKNLFIDFLYTKDWRFLEENKEDIVKISNDLGLHFGEVFRKLYKIN